jgi:hypothetical protein
MHSHPLARLTPISQERLIRRHLGEAVPLKALAAQAGISLRSAYMWLARFRQGGPAAVEFYSQTEPPLATTGHLRS